MDKGPLFIRMLHEGREKTGFIQDGKTYSCSYKSMQECVEKNFKPAGLSLVTGEVRILSPVKPSKVVGLGWNYSDHNKELKCTTEKPIVFLKPASSVIGPGDPIVIPAISGQVEHEIELGVVIGKRAKHVPAAKAMDYVAGYTIILDITARDLQWKARECGDPWDIAKGLDTFAPIGPGIIPRDVIPDPSDLDLRLKVNGVVKQESNTRNMLHKIPDIISYVSSFYTLEPCDVIATGTPEGVGPIKPGDVIEAEIEGIGVLKNPVKAESGLR